MRWTSPPDASFLCLSNLSPPLPALAPILGPAYPSALWEAWGPSHSPTVPLTCSGVLWRDYGGAPAPLPSELCLQRT